MPCIWAYCHQPATGTLTLTCANGHQSGQDLCDQHATLMRTLITDGVDCSICWNSTSPPGQVTTPWTLAEPPGDQP